MSVLATPLPHRPFSDTELFTSSSGSVPAHAELPPVPPHIALPIPLPPQGTSFSTFQQRHTSSYPMPQQQTFSALGPAQPDVVPTNAIMPHAETSPSAPQGSAVGLADLTPDIHPQTPLPPTPEPSPPRRKVLGPTMMIKLAPPADDHSYHRYDVLGTEAEPSSVHSGESSGSTSTTPRRLPTLSIDIESFDSSPSHRTPSPKLGTSSGTPSQARVKSSSSTDPKPPRPKSMGPPPRPRRSQTAYPHGPVSVRMAESRSADSRERKLRATSVLRASSYSQVRSGSPGPSRAFSDAGSGSVTPRAFSASDLALPDLGGPDGLEAKVVLLGSQGVGKTSLILRYTTRTFSVTPAPATIGSSLHTRKLVHSGVRVKLQIWDTAGQERFRSMAPIYYRGAHVCVLVYDISDKQSFEDVRSWLEELGRSVPKETVIFVAGAKIDLNDRREVEFDFAKEMIRSWISPPSPPPPVLTPMTSPPQRSLFRSSTSTSRIDSPSPTPTISRAPSTRIHSYSSHITEPTLRSAPISSSSRHSADSPRPLASVPFPSPKDIPVSPEKSKAKEIANEKRSRRHSAKPFPVKVTNSASTSLATSPSRLEFPTLQSPTGPTSATFTEPVGPLLASPTSSPGHRSSGGRFSISGISEVLGLNRTVSMSGAISSLHQLTEAPSPPPLQTSSPGSSSFNPPQLPSSPRTRVESSPLFPSYGSDRNARRKSDEWSRGGWKMGEGPGVAEALGEFGAGVKRRESEELLGGTNRSLPVLGNPSYKVNQVRSRAGSLGRDPRLIGELEEVEDEWGVQVENVRLGECSALTGEGVEKLFKAISSILVERKDKIERERVLRHKDSVILVDPSTNPRGLDKEKKSGCCV